MKYALFLSLVVLTLLGVSTSVAHAADTAPAQTVRTFYNWYVTNNAHVGEQLAEVKGLFEPTLYDSLAHADPGTFLANTCPGYLDVSRCPYGAFDPFVYAKTSASSYSIGAVRLEGNRASVAVTLHMHGRLEAASHVTVVLAGDGSRYTIADLQYPQPHFYNFGPVADLRDFLMLIGAMPLDSEARRSATNAIGVVKAFYDTYIASHGHIEKHMLQAKALLESSLFGDIASSYATGGDFTVSPCSGCKGSVPFDPFANASSPASSYATGVPRREGNSILVPVSLRFPGNRPMTVNHITVVVHQAGAWYEIGNLLYDEPHYYYADPIADLRKFLGTWNC
jgi:hypothetical protein